MRFLLLASLIAVLMVSVTRAQTPEVRARAAVAVALALSTPTVAPTPAPKAEPCCSPACTCGCQEGLPCRCGTAASAHRSPPTAVQGWYNPWDGKHHYDSAIHHPAAPVANYAHEQPRFYAPEHVFYSPPAAQPWRATPAPVSVFARPTWGGPGAVQCVGNR